MAAAPSPDELEEIHAILAPALDDDGAAERRARILAEDARDEGDVRERFADLDALIEELRAALEARRATASAPPGSADAEGDRPRDRLSGVPPIPVDDARPADLDDIDRLDSEMPPLPEPSRPEVATDGADPPPPPPVPEPLNDLPAVPRAADSRRAVQLLYDDIVYLYGIKDWGGMLISTERMLIMAEMDGQVKEFVEANEVMLLNLYESYLGPFDKVPRVAHRSVDNAMPEAYLQAQKLASVFEMIDGERSMKALFRDAPHSPLETCSAINQLRRSGVVTLE